MNSLSLYVTTNQIILKADPGNSSTWQDLYRLLPYLRNSLSCVVCSNLLMDPQSPVGGRCNHHVCKNCRGGRKKLKPACSWCRNCVDYNDNKSLKILLQCYQQMCQHLVQSPIYAGLLEQASVISPVVGVERGAGNLLALIREGSEFHDDYQSQGGIPKSTYNILPCIYTNSSTQTLQLAPPMESNPVPQQPNILNILNTTSTSSTPSRANMSSNLYSVMYPGINKITIKRKPNELIDLKQQLLPLKKDPVEKVPVFKKPVNKCVLQSKKGCRCGNATATPGKLTCCGQRCPCYVESKACIECRCRGCRNPHRPDGLKVRPIIPELQSYQMSSNPQIQEPQMIHNQPIKLGSIDMDPHFNFDSIGLKTYKVVAGGFNSLSIPTTLLMNAPLLEEDLNLEV